MAITKSASGLASAFDPTKASQEPERVEREPMRSEPEDHLQRAAKKLAQMRGLYGDEMLDQGSDEFFVEKSDIPPGWDYQWKRYLLLGKEDPAYQVQLARAGWEAVRTGRHPHYMPYGTPEDEPIMRKGNMLMERPMELTIEARRIEDARARSQVRVKEQQLTSAPAGQFERDNKGAPLATIKKTHVPMAVPE
jgi:hypothetical protein